jgi:hypothetical protein
MLFHFFQSLAQLDHKALQVEMVEMANKVHQVQKVIQDPEEIEAQQDKVLCHLQDSKQDGAHIQTLLTNQQNLVSLKETMVG